MEILRAIEPEDLDVMYLIENDLSLWQYGSTSSPFSHFTLKEYIVNSNNDIFIDHQIRFAITSGGTTVGFLDITNFVPLHHRAEVGIVLCTEAQHQGLAGKALLEAEAYARHCQIHSLHAVVSSHNEQAQRLFERASYKKISVLKEWLFENGTYTDAILYQKLI